LANVVRAGGYAPAKETSDDESKNPLLNHGDGGCKQSDHRLALVLSLLCSLATKTKCQPRQQKGRGLLPTFVTSVKTWK